MLLFITLFVSNLSFAQDLEVGDVLMQNLHCRLCSLIEAQTHSQFSHIGIVLSLNPLLIGEAFQKVRATSFEEFRSKSQKGSKILVLRHIYSKHFRNLEFFYRKYFHNLLYDSSFLWDNKKIYCSELIWKLLKTQTHYLPKPRPMMYDENYEQWKKYFKGNVPIGEIGVSPAQFERSPYFKKVMWK